MADLMFKRGLQESLPSIAQDGCFYLTTDSNRLYIGRSDQTMALLNQTVQIVDSIELLRAAADNGTVHKNDFYYCTAENVLAVYDGTNWQQINPDTNNNDTIEVKEVSFSDNISEDDKEVKYVLTLKQQKTNISGETEDPYEITATLTLKSDDISGIVPEAAEVGLTATKSLDSVTISTTGDGSDSNTNITLASAENGNITVDADGNTVYISAKDTTYRFGTDENGLYLSATDGENFNVKFDADHSENDDIVVAIEEDTITYGHKQYGEPEVSTVTNDASLSSEGTLNIISGLEISNGHIVNVSTEELTLPADTRIQSIERSADTDNAWKLIVKETNGGAEFPIDFSSDANDLKEELTSLIEEGLAAANTALTYKGTISDYSELSNKENVEVGDVYLLDRESNYGGELYKAGDMFIATTSDETDTGIIDGFVEWTYIPSGDELNTDTRFYGDVDITSGDLETGESGSVTFIVKAEADAAGGENIPDENESLTLQAGKDIVITNSDGNAVINHRQYSDDVISEEDNVENASTITAITGLTVENGHIVEATSQTFTIPEVELSGADDQIKLSSGSGYEAAISVTGDDWITPTVDNNELSITHNDPQTESVTVEAENEYKQLPSNGTFNIISSVAYDAKGHIVEVATDALQLPESLTYELSVAEDSDGTAIIDEIENPYIVLKDGNGATTSIQAVGDSGSVVLTGTSNNFKVSLVWGTF